MRLCYKETIYEQLFGQVEQDMKANRSMMEKHQKLLSEQKAQMQTLLTKIKLLNEAAEKREDKRCWYDHYRVKT
jgi:hypothetical protein